MRSRASCRRRSPRWHWSVRALMRAAHRRARRRSACMSGTGSSGGLPPRPLSCRPRRPTWPRSSPSSAGAPVGSSSSDPRPRRTWVRRLRALRRSVPDRLGLLVMTDEEGGGVQRMADLVGRLPWARDMGRHWTPRRIRQTRRRRGAADGRDRREHRPRPGGRRRRTRCRPRSGRPGRVALVRRPDGPWSRPTGSPICRGCCRVGYCPTLKHFPGLGGASRNTDYGTAYTVPWSRLRRVGLPPFIAGIRRRRARGDGVERHRARADPSAGQSVGGGHPQGTRPDAALRRPRRDRLVERGRHLRRPASTYRGAAVAALEAGADMIMYNAPNPARSRHGSSTTWWSPRRTRSGTVGCRAAGWPPPHAPPSWRGTSTSAAEHHTAAAASAKMSAMLGLVLVVVLGVALLLGGALARRFPVAPALVLVAMGVLIGFVPTMRRGAAAARGGAAAVPAGAAVLGEPDDLAARDPQQPAHGRADEHRAGGRHRRGGGRRRARPGPGLGPGLGARRGRRAHRRDRGRRAGPRAAAPHRDRAAGREPGQRRQRAGDLRTRGRRHGRRARTSPCRT